MTLVEISAKEAVSFVSRWHYSGTASPGVLRYGWKVGGTLIGVSIYNLGNHDMRKGVFGEEHLGGVLHHHRLAILPTAPHGTASQFLGACLKQVKIDRPETTAIVTYADLCQSHNGTVYRATNAIPCGVVGKGNLKFRDLEGVIRVTQSLKGTWPERRAEAERKGWAEIRCLGKVRYVWLLGSGRQKKKLRAQLLWPESDVPSVAPPSPQEVRSWAESKGLPVGSRGRVSRELIALYRNRSS